MTVARFDPWAVLAELENAECRGTSAKAANPANPEVPGPSDLPADWAACLAGLWRMPVPACIRPERRWKEVLADTDRFVDAWGPQGASLGWTTLDMFGAHPTHPIERLDCAGLVLLLHGEEVAALTADGGCIRTRSGSLLTYYRRPLTAAVPLWELGGE